MSLNLHWYVIYTKPRWEKKVAVLLENAGIENYCPLNSVLKQWSDRKKIVQEPLFKSYVFVRIEESERLKILNITGVVNFLFWDKKPGIVRNEEIEAIRQMLSNYDDVKVVAITPDVKIEDLVTINAGPFVGREADVIAVSKHTVKVVIHSLGFEMVASIPKKNILKKQNNHT